MKPAKQVKVTVFGEVIETKDKDGTVETSVKVKTKEEVISEKARPVTEVVLEKQKLKIDNFKKIALAEVRKAAQDGKEIKKEMLYWKQEEATKKKAPVKKKAPAPSAPTDK